MNIIICGVGRVGLSIASYLSMQDNNITVIDSDPYLVKRMSDTYDISGVVGYASQPDVLRKAGAEDADIIIAVTDCDEVNMVACQVAHSVFGIHKKIARIRNKEYRDPAWSNLFSKNHMPIDVIISPEEEIAETIISRMSVPGTTNDISLADEKVHISGFIITEGNKMIGAKIKDIYYAQRENEFRIFLVVRDTNVLATDENTIIEEGDEIYFVCRRASLFSLLENIGGNNNIYNGNIVICGGGIIGQSICEKIQTHEKFQKKQVVVIENNLETARMINRTIPNALILNGSALDYDILKESGVNKASLFVTVMNSNENNILSAVLAKKMGAQYAIALSTNRLYNQLLPDRFIDAIVNPETVTVSKILHNLRKGYIQSVHTIRQKNVEVIEAHVTENCSITNVPLGEVNLAKGIIVLSIYRKKDNNVVFPTDKTIIKAGDTLIFATNNVKQGEIEKLFSFSINLF